jgi:hypothetical protein
MTEQTDSSGTTANIQRVSQGETPHHVVNGVKPNPAQEEREYL